MESKSFNQTPVDKWIVEPVNQFISKSTTSGFILFGAAIAAIILANSPLAESFHHLWEIKFSIGFNEATVSKTLHHWINDGLMAIFFFVVGLELKREIVAGKLSKPSDALFPIVAAIGGMLVPALIYYVFNPTGEMAKGWGIPMATDIAFALGILYLLGDKVPLSLKVFLTALAIVDDIGAVLVIAFFYTSDINYLSLGIGGACFIILVIANRIGVRSTLFYGIVGIGGLWLAFLMSGVHATIAAVIAAMTIPANIKASKNQYLERLENLIGKFKLEKTDARNIVTDRQYHVLEEVQKITRNALTPLQRLEHGLHPFVAFIVLPVFAFSNAGVELSADALTHVSSSVFLGVFFGLLAGKFIGVFGLVALLIQFRIVSMPSGMNNFHLIGVGLLAAIGFTMSLFITGLAFGDSIYLEQAKMGVIFASIVASISGYFVVKYANSLENRMPQ